MQLNLGCFVTNDLYCLDDHYESVTLKLWRHLAQDSRTILDIGSHIGTFALVAASRNQQAQVIAVEADPDNFALLRNHCVAWHNITSIHAAIADRADEMWFLPEAGNDGGGRLSSARPPDGSGFPVRTISLADLCRQQRLAGVDLMKLDVEGFEHTLMTMNSDFWEEFPPQNLIVELTCERHKAALTEDLFHAMKRRGYRWRRVQGLYAIPWGKPCDLANWHFWR
ncbi:MAG: FkbM family methyltransferase [Kiritimatiellaeota bacterium]|nr:FkbM family methyltransferase [Kiritimatiellota bacterium]